MKRVLYLAQEHNAYSDRGHEVRTAEAIAKSGHKVVLVTNQQPLWKQGEKPASLTHLPPVDVNNPATWAEVAQHLPSDVDAAFASSASGAPILAEWKKRTGKPVVCQVLDTPKWRWAHGNDGPWLKSWTPWFHALCLMDRVVANMRRTKETLLECAPWFDRKAADLPPINVLYYGIDTEAADAAGRFVIDPESLARIGSRKHCVNAARLVPHKGFDLAIMALGLIPEARRPMFHLVGEGEDRGRLVQLAQWVGLEARHFTGWGGVDDSLKFGLAKMCDFGLSLSVNPDVPSQFPLEAVYCRRPCVVADIPINHDRYGDMPGNVSLTYVNPWDTREVAKSIQELHGTESWNAEETRAWIRENRSFRSHARSILKALEALAR